MILPELNEHYNDLKKIQKLEKQLKIQSRFLIVFGFILITIGLLGILF